MAIRQHVVWMSLLSTHALAAPKWNPVALTQELYPIARLESSWGRNISHQPNSKGRWHSAYGALGFKASTGYESMLLSKRFMNRWSIGRNQTIDITDKAVFFQMFISNAKFYNELANIHWQYLKRNTENIEQAIYAWRWGLGAATVAENHSEDKYVAAYLAQK